MIEAIWEESFIKKLKKLIKNNPFDPNLKTHKLSGTLSGYWAFSIDYYYRIIFRFSGDQIVIFITIGSHDEVY